MKNSNETDKLLIVAKDQMQMKKIFLPFLLLFITQITLNAQEQTPATEAGEDFDLNAVMQVLENAEDLADFEKKINDEKYEVTNLDLNKDDQIDFIKVVEYDEENTRLIVLQAVLGDNDFQDIATIEIEKHSEEEISLQVIGDPDIYGPDYIVEPAPDESNQGGGGEHYIKLPILSNELSVAVFVSVHRWRPISPLFRIGRAVFISSIVNDPLLAWFIIRRPIARSNWRGRSRRYSKSRYRSSRSRHSKRGRNMYSNKRKRSPTAKKNFGPKATPSKGPNTGPTNQQNKKPTASPSKSTSINKSTGTKKNTPQNKSKQSAGPPKKKKN